jgi:serine/threonine-protein kinase
MSPEQVKGESTDARSDLYSVGVSLYEMVTGRRPFQAESDYSIMSAHVKDAPKPPIEFQPGIPATLNEIILIAIAKDPAQRFQTADAFRNALSSVHGGATVSLPVIATPAAKLDPDATAPMIAVAATATSRPVVPPVAVAASTPSVPLPPPASGHRGMYMALGALVVLAALVVAGIYVPRHSKTEAKTSEGTSAASQTSAVVGEPSDSQNAGSPPAPSPQTPAPQPEAPAAGVAQPPATAAASASASGANSMNGAVPLAATRTVEDGKSGTAKATARNHAVAAKPSTTQPAPETEAAASAAAPASNAEMDEVEHEVDQLVTRAAAVNSGLDRLQQQQSAAGYGLRGDMVAKQASLKTNLAKAQDAVEQGDVQRAKKYSGLAQADAEALEHFLGR